MVPAACGWVETGYLCVVCVSLCVFPYLEVPVACCMFSYCLSFPIEVHSSFLISHFCVFPLSRLVLVQVIDRSSCSWPSPASYMCIFLSFFFAVFSLHTHLPERPTYFKFTIHTPAAAQTHRRCPRPSPHHLSHHPLPLLLRHNTQKQVHPRRPPPSKGDTNPCCGLIVGITLPP